MKIVFKKVFSLQNELVKPIKKRCWNHIDLINHVTSSKLLSQNFLRFFIKFEAILFDQAFFKPYDLQIILNEFF